MKSHQSPDLSQTLQSDWSDSPRPTFPHLGCICSSQQTIKVTDFGPLYHMFHGGLHNCRTLIPCLHMQLPPFWCKRMSIYVTALCSDLLEMCLFSWWIFLFPWCFIVSEEFHPATVVDSAVAFTSTPNTSYCSYHNHNSSQWSDIFNEDQVKSSGDWWVVTKIIVANLPLASAW
jgi:hypothetical protein